MFGTIARNRRVTAAKSATAVFGLAIAAVTMFRKRFFTQYSSVLFSHRS